MKTRKTLQITNLTFIAFDRYDSFPNIDEFPNFRKGQIKCKESTFKFLSVKESCRIIVWSLKTVNSPSFLAPAWIQSRFPPARTRVMPGHVSDCAALHVSPGLATSEAQHLTNFETVGGKLLPSAEINSVEF